MNTKLIAIVVSAVAAAGIVVAVTIIVPESDDTRGQQMQEQAIRNMRQADSDARKMTIYGTTDPAEIERIRKQRQDEVDAQFLRLGIK